MKSFKILKRDRFVLLNSLVPLSKTYVIIR